MKTRTIISVVCSVCLSLLVLGGVASAASGVFDSITIGKQGVGGVTFFNGTIVNNTTSSGKDNPVTFGDNVRIDGRIQRGHNNAGDNWNVIVNDGLEVNKTLAVTGTSAFTGKVTFNGGTNLDYAASNHNHDASYYKKTEADAKYSLTTHNHDDRYYTETEANSKFVNKNDLLTSNVQISAPAFSPSEDGYDFDLNNNGESLTLNNSLSPNWSANVQLPHGATVTGFTLISKDSDASIGAASNLLGFNFGSNVDFNMAGVVTSGSSGLITTDTDSTINSPLIDNYNNLYRVTVGIGSTSISLYSVAITYTIPRSSD